MSTVSKERGEENGEVSEDRRTEEKGGIKREWEYRERKREEGGIRRERVHMFMNALFTVEVTECTTTKCVRFVVHCMLSLPPSLQVVQFWHRYNHISHNINIYLPYACYII